MANILLPRINNLEDDQSKQKSILLPGTPLAKTRKGPNLPPSASSLKTRYVTTAEGDRRKSALPKISDLAVSAAGVAAQSSQEDINDTGKSETGPRLNFGLGPATLEPLLLRQKGAIDEMTEEAAEEVRKAMQGQIKRLKFANGTFHDIIVNNDYIDGGQSLDPELVRWEEFEDENLLKENLEEVLLCKKMVLKFMIAKPTKAPGIVAIPVFHCPKCLEAWKIYHMVPDNCQEMELPTRGVPMALAEQSSEFFFENNNIELIEIKEKKTYTQDDIHRLNTRRKTVVLLQGYDDIFDSDASRSASQTISTLTPAGRVDSKTKTEFGYRGSLPGIALHKNGSSFSSRRESESGLVRYGGLSDQETLDIVCETDSKIFLRKVTRKDSDLTRRVPMDYHRENAGSNHVKESAREIVADSQRSGGTIDASVAESDAEVDSKGRHIDRTPNSSFHPSSPAHVQDVAWPKASSPKEGKTSKVTARRIADVKDDFAAAKDFLKGVARSGKKQQSLDKSRQTTPEFSGFQSDTSSCDPESLATMGKTNMIENHSSGNDTQRRHRTSEQEGSVPNGLSPITYAGYPFEVHANKHEEDQETAYPVRQALRDIPEHDMPNDAANEMEGDSLSRQIQSFSKPGNESAFVHKIEFGASDLPGLTGAPAEKIDVESEDPREVLARMQRRKYSVGMKKNSSLIEGKRKSSKQVTQSTSAAVQEIVLDQPRAPPQQEGNAYIKRKRRGTMPVASDDRYVMQGGKQQAGMRSRGNKPVLPGISDSKDGLGLEYSSTNYSKLPEEFDEEWDDATEGRAFNPSDEPEEANESTLEQMKMKLTKGKPSLGEISQRELRGPTDEIFEVTSGEKLNSSEKSTSRETSAFLNANKRIWTEKNREITSQLSPKAKELTTAEIEDNDISFVESTLMNDMMDREKPSASVVAFDLGKEKSTVRQDQGDKYKEVDGKATKKTFFAVSKLQPGAQEKKEKTRKEMPPTPSPDLKEKMSLSEFYGLSMRRFTCSYTFSFFDLPEQYRSFNESVKAKINEIGRPRLRAGKGRKSLK